MKQQNQQLAQHLPHQERRKAGNQLEAIGAHIKSKTTGLNQSVVLIDHLEDNEKDSMQIDDNP